MMLVQKTANVSYVQMMLTVTSPHDTFEISFVGLVA